MFEAAELGREVAKEVYKEEEPKLRTALLEAQRALKKSNVPVLILVAGVEGAGKGEVVNLLNKWLDTRGVETHAFLEPTEEEKRHPPHWQFWRTFPARGRIAVMFGSWYTNAIIDHVREAIGEEAFDRQLAHIRLLERLLADDGHLVVKFWYHLAKDEQKRRAKAQKKREKSLYLSPYIGKFAKRYEEFTAASQRAIRATDTAHAPWHLIEAIDPNYRDLATGRILLQSIEHHLQANGPPSPSPIELTLVPEIPGATETVLDRVDLSLKLKDKEYDEQLEEYQKELNHWIGKAWKKKRSLVAVFEGWDAAGKGGVIRRATSAMDARLMRVVPVSTPTDEEKAHHYLWRFWRKLPLDGLHVIFDRSWYGRVLVERVEGYAARAEWMRAYQEINEFEEQLAAHGSIVCKFWLHLSRDEQYRRFKDREEKPWKQHKITEDDWRNREKWEDYLHAVNDMVQRTGTEYAPWHLVPSENKKYARIFVLKTLCETIRTALGKD